ncbi:MAG: precorrin-8X methylmutase [Bacteroidota bacterium]
MPPLFDAYAMVDWSAAAVPATGADSVWIDSAERRNGALTPLRLANPRTRREAVALLADLLSDLVARDCVTLVGFDFAFGYPVGFAQRLRRPEADWRSVWREIAARVRDADNNANNRFEVAAALNEHISGGPFPFWGCPASAAGPRLSSRKPAGYGFGDLAEFRMCDLAGGGAHPVWKLAYPGCVGSQTLLGIAHLQALRQHPWLADVTRVWPFETGLRAVQRPAAGGWRLLFAEIYPSIFDSRGATHAVKDARQVQTVVERVHLLDEAGRLAPLFAGPPTLTAEQRLAIETEEGWILGIETIGPRRRPRAADTTATTAGGYDYIRDPEEIYRRSFAAIRAEADLSALPAHLQPLAVRLIHAAGDPEIVADLAWAEDAVAAGRRALAGGAPILVDAHMLAAGVIRARLPADNAVVCTLAEAGLAEAAQAIGNTRSAAAVDRWLDRLDGAVVAIGNAPTALFRLLELLDGGAPRPAVILGFPVGFVGAAEAKEALIAHPLRVPFVTLRGRRGGSAIAAAAVNALAGAVG